MSTSVAQPPTYTRAPTGNLGWTRGPSRPQLRAGAVHVWRAGLDSLADDLSALLDRGERSRADAIVRERQRTLWLRARAVLKALLGVYLDVDPASVRVVTDPNGKPRVDRSPKTAPVALAFSLSHSRSLALFAFTATRSVGIDVEDTDRPALPVLSLAARAFGDAEATRLGRLEPRAAQREFLQAWTRREAILKCRGVEAALTAPRNGREEPTVHKLDLGPGAVAALATEPAVTELRCWQWQPAQAPIGGRQPG